MEARGAGGTARCPEGVGASALGLDGMLLVLFPLTEQCSAPEVRVAGDGRCWSRADVLSPETAFGDRRVSFALRGVASSFVS